MLTQSWHIGNARLTRHFRAEDGRLRTVALAQHRSGRRSPVRGPEFVLKCQEVEVSSDAFRLAAPPRQTATEIIFELVPVLPRQVVSVQVRYHTSPGDAVLRKTITIRNDRVPAPFAVEEVFVEYLFLDGVITDLAVEWGQPAFAGDWFLGIEHPAFWATNHGGEIGLAVAPATVIPPGGRLTLPAAILGASDADDPLPAFGRYLDTVRAQPARVLALMNTWYHAPFATEQVCEQALGALTDRLLRPYPGTLDAFVIDDGWDDLEELWQPHRQRFPRGLRPFADKVRAAGLRFGLWASPWGGYEQARLKRAHSGARQGFGTVPDAQGNPERLCLGEERYFHYYRDRLVERVAQDDVSFFKFDGFPYVCNDPRHGHPIGRGSVTWNANRMIEIARVLRQLRPDIFLLGTIGFWQSPWWLMHLDAIFVGGGDDGQLGAGTARQQDITYRDQCIHDTCVSNRSRLPLASLGVHGIIKANYRHAAPYHNPALAFADESLADWESLVWTNVGRGVGLVEAYLSPELLGSDHCRVLAEGLAWLRAHWQTLRWARWWGGAPAANQAYGILHEGDADRLLFARNPTAQLQRLALPPGVFTPLKTVGAVTGATDSLILGPFALGIFGQTRER